MGKTVGFQRIFTCKKCGKEAVEGLYHWKKKSQKDKNVCLSCIRKRELSKQTAREMSAYMPWSTYRL